MATTIKGQRFKTYTYAAASALTPSLGEQMAITTITGIQESPFMIVGDGVKTVAQLIAVITSNDTKVITANYTVESWVKRIVVNSTAAINITIPNTRPVNDELEIERALASANYYYLLRSGSETIEGLTSYGIYGTKKVTITKTTSTAWLRTDYETKPLLSDLSRVMALNGDGIPMFPDNVAERTYVPNFSTTDGWQTNNSTLSVASNILKITASTSALYGSRKTLSAFNGKMFRLRIRTSRSTSIRVRYNDGGGALPVILTLPTIAGIWSYADGFLPSGSVDATIYIDTTTGATAGDTIEISQENTYIGSGANDSKVYGKDGQTVFENVGVLPVPGPRGMAMSFLGNGYLTGNSSVFGSTGTPPIYWKRGRIGVAETIASNQSATTNGIRYHIDASNDLYALFGGSSPVSVLIKTGFTDITAYHSFGVIVSGTTATPFYDFALGTSVSVTPVAGLANLTIGRNPLTSSDNAIGSGYISIYANQWTLKEVNRYYDGDDAVDSQQKAQNNVPYAIKVCDSKGNIRQPGLPVYADNTTALAGGLVAGEQYRTSTGILMVVY